MWKLVRVGGEGSLDVRYNLPGRCDREPGLLASEGDAGENPTSVSGGPKARGPELGYYPSEVKVLLLALVGPH